ncbi:hypothetical protein GGI25_005004 [Coemansia spiralis]|uniref:Uncharacterized protein n=1 Tax=Coemansia spiralis TaxID=417178 RepID=A0A9W8FZE8_9FUNG|nr:hypothetical protein GGI25_005004 [Coemansia spiralis]
MALLALLMIVEQRLLVDTECVIDQAQPTNPARKAFAEWIAGKVAADIEDLIAIIRHETDAHGANSRYDILASAGSAFSVDSAIHTALPWLLPPADKAPSSQTKRRICS